MKLSIIGFIVVLLLSVCIPKEMHAVPKTITDIEVIDIPNDDGTGLQIMWKALPKESRIISYRIYRGTNKDTLFFIGEIPINVKTGANSETMSFYDKDFNEFLDIRSPGKLKKEKKAGQDSPFYQKIPKDMSIVGPMLQHYSILGVLPKDEFYYKTTQVEQTEGEETIVYAGVKSNQITMLKKLIPGNEYHYSVIAVDEKRKFWPADKIASGIPIDNEPANPTDFYATYVTDKQVLNFEWGHPLSYDDIYTYKIYAKSPAEDNIGKQIFETKTPQPFPSADYASIKLDDNKVIDKNGDILYDFAKNSIDKCEFYLVFTDYAGLKSTSEPISAKHITSNDLPTIPKLYIIDKKNDKGDYNTLFWGKPIAYINSVQPISKDKIVIGYDYNTNCNYKINEIYFDIYDKDYNLIKNVNEFFQDNIFNLKIDKCMEELEELNVKISFKYNGKVDQDYVIEQKLKYSPEILTLKAGPVSIDGNILEKYTYTLMKKTQNNEIYRSIKKAAGIERESDDKVAYESNVVKGVSNYDLEKNLFLVDTNIDLVWDKEAKSTISTSIYVSEKDKTIDNMKKQIESVEEMLKKATTDEEKAYYGDYLVQFQNSLKALESNSLLQEVNSITNQKKRMKKIASIREVDKRYFNYFMMMSNGKAYVVEDDMQLVDGELEYVIPAPNWFDFEKLPALIASLLFGLLVFLFVTFARQGKNLYVRPIAGIDEIDNAIGRATEMGRPILFCPGLSGISDVATLAGLSILGRIAKRAAEYDTRILVPCRDYIVIPIAQEIVREAHYEAGRPDSFDKNNVFFVSDQQFAYVAGVNGVMIREKTAANFYMGMFYAESLIMTETGNATGAIQIAGTDAITQVPFFITTCDYTLIGEELYAASAYLARQPLMLGTLKAQDYAKFFVLLFLILGTLLSTFHVTAIIDKFPNK